MFPLTHTHWFGILVAAFGRCLVKGIVTCITIRNRNRNMGDISVCVIAGGRRNRFRTAALPFHVRVGTRFRCDFRSGRSIELNAEFLTGSLTGEPLVCDNDCLDRCGSLLQFKGSGIL